jgi:hypothetical protein
MPAMCPHVCARERSTAVGSRITQALCGRLHALAGLVAYLAATLPATGKRGADG